MSEEIDAISVIIHRWENTLCPDCGAHMKLYLGYIQKCSVKPNEHLLCDGQFYLRRIKEVIEK
ncbi:hypothetical protein LCGC14_1685360 [marine sediment metagenome]|uniref:Transposase zinc-ribbon domain-containing protein n=1 Tax=marine sediment metagenome TaxID=412755 RepID=A0A0F9I9X0_9ZZZZ